MLIELIRHIELAMLAYVKFIEGKHYHGDHHFSLAYVKASALIGDNRKQSMSDLTRLCHNALLRKDSPKNLAYDVMDYLQTTRGTFEKLFNRTGDLHDKVVHAIAFYSPVLIQWKNKKAFLNKHAPDEKGEPVCSSISSPDVSGNHEEVQTRELILQLQTANQMLQKQLDKQQLLIEKLSDKLEQAQLTIIELQRHSSTQASLAATVVATSPTSEFDTPRSFCGHD